MENLSLIEVTQKHFKAIIEKRIEDIISVYLNSDDLLVFVEGPRWQTVGFENVAKGWRDFVNSDIEMRQCDWIENLTSKIVGKMGFVAGVVELQVNIGNELKIIKFRGTFVFQ
jgi:hypothetical protein